MYLLTIYHNCGTVKARLLIDGAQLNKLQYGAGLLRCTVRVATSSDMRKVLGR